MFFVLSKYLPTTIFNNVLYIYLFVITNTNLINTVKSEFRLFFFSPLIFLHTVCAFNSICAVTRVYTLGGSVEHACLALLAALAIGTCSTWGAVIGRVPCSRAL